jgi:hypothetical protein
MRYRKKRRGSAGRRRKSYKKMAPAARMSKRRTRLIGDRM